MKTKHSWWLYVGSVVLLVTACAPVSPPPPGPPPTSVTLAQTSPPATVVSTGLASPTLAPVVTATAAPPATAPLAPSPRPTLVPTTTPTPSPAPTLTATIPRPSVRSPTGLTLPAGFEAEVVARGLMGPTQMIVGPDGWLWVAQLNGEEDARQGQIVALPLDLTAGGQRRVLLSGLDKPTGITLLGDSLWIATRREIQRARLTPGGVARPEIIRVALPFNGRSGGTLTTSPNGRLLYETSGELVGNGAASGSGMLWELDPMSPLQSRSLARGLKNGYAHVFDEPGRLWVTEVAEDIVNDTVPADELNLLVWDNVPPARGEIIPDFGWPLCFADRQPALNYGADPVRCQTTRAPVAMFPPRSTPVSIVLSPWERDVLLVALWGPTDPAIVRIPIVMDGDNAKARSVEPFITGLQTPQHLFVLDSGQLLVSDHATGTVYRIRRQG